MCIVNCGNATDMTTASWSHSDWSTVIPIDIEINGVGRRTITAVKADRFETIRVLESVVTKPQIIASQTTTGVEQTYYTYTYPNAYICIDKLHEFKSSANTAVFNPYCMSEQTYSTYEAAPTAICDATIHDNYNVMTTFDSFNINSFNRTSLMTANYMLPVVTQKEVTTTANVQSPTRTINYYIGFSK